MLLYIPCGKQQASLTGHRPHKVAAVQNSKTAKGLLPCRPSSGRVCLTGHEDYTD